SLAHYTQGNLDNYYGGTSGNTYWAPNGSLAAFDGLDLNGLWTLDVVDTSSSGGQNGTLLSWSLHFSDGTCSMDCAIDAGTINAAVTGQSNQNYILCNDDQITLSSNNDFMLPPAGCAGCLSGFAFLYYECPPTSLDNLSDPCYTLVFNTNETLNLTNNGGDNSTLLSNLNANLVNNTFYLVPQVRDADYYFPNPSIGYTDFNNDDCYTIADEAVEITFLNPITFQTNATCQGMTVKIEGGYPEFYADNYSLVVNSPTGAVLSNNEPQHGEKIVISNVSAGDLIELNVTDGNACTDNFTTTYGLSASTLSASLNDDNVCAENAISKMLDPNPQGGTPPYFYHWNVGSIKTSTLNITEAGTYTVTISDADSCSVVRSAVISEMVLENAFFEYPKNQYCLTETTDITPINIATDGGVFEGVGGLIVDATTGTVDVSTAEIGQHYLIRYITTGMCPNTHTFDLQFKGIEVDIDLGNTSCVGENTGTIDIKPKNETDNYDYIWDNGLPAQASQNNLATGNYTITISDAFGCVQIETLPIIASFDPPTITAVDTICETASTPELIAMGSGDTIVWYVNNPVLFPNFPALAIGDTLIPDGFLNLGDNTFWAVEGLNNDCVSDPTMVTIHVLSVPETPTGDTYFGICNNEPIPTFTALAETDTTTILWYNSDPSVGNPSSIFSGENFTPTITPLVEGMYNFWAVTEGPRCPSMPLLVQLQLSQQPTAPLFVTNAIDPACTGDTPPLLEAIAGSGGVLQWYDVNPSLNDVSPVGIGANFTPNYNENVVDTYFYWITELLNGCESPANSTFITVNETPPNPNIVSQLVLCALDSVPTISASNTLGTLHWFDENPINGNVTPIQIGGGLVPPIDNTVAGLTSFWVYDIALNCTSDIERLDVVVHYTPMSDFT
ncbi:MAG: hypothetical protein ACPGXL_08830, partial [Chitinophagales bacterium]